MAWRKFEDLSGKRFGRLTVLHRVETPPGRQVYFLCRCDCGTEKAVQAPKLKSGNTRSCGCYNSDCRVVHGHARSASKTSEYNIYHGMLARCYNIKSLHYPTYGAAGVDVCERWRNSFEAFLEDMGPRPSKYHSIDRIDNSRGYSPDNCRWAESVTQMNNRKINHRVTFRGKTMTIAEWSKYLGIADTTIHTRLSRGWSVEEALGLAPNRALKRVNRISDFQI